MLVRYPSLEDLEHFKGVLFAYGHPYLPSLDERWSSDVFAIKNHRRPDGNKRSALCCYIYLLALNGKTSLVPGGELEELAVMVASSRGNSEKELLPMLQDIFSIQVSNV